MKTETDGLWFFALAAECRAFSPTSFFSSLCFLFLVWVGMVFLFWVVPGGPAWGRYWWKAATKPLKPIPGPRGLPILGSMNLMANLGHRRLAAAAERFGAKRLMAFSLGETRVIVTCSPDVAKEILNSSVFADRPVKESAYSLMFNRAIGFAPYGVYWRTLRRIAATHLFSPRQIHSSAAQRSQIAAQMVSIFGCCKGEIRVRDSLKRASLSNIMCSVFGSKYNESKELKELVEEGYELLGILNWSDHLPWLSWFDPQNIRLRCSKLVPKVNQFVSRILAEHSRAQTQTHTVGDNTKEAAMDFVDVLLSLEGPDKLSETDMIAVLWEMVFRGTDTVAVLVEWILARMVLHPEIQLQVQDELDRVVGKSRAVTEEDIQAMVYLPAVVKEVLRLHPPGPLLSWSRLAITDTTIDGRHVPAGTTAMVNMWAITRDPQVWQDPLEFKPERFFAKEAQSELSVLGSDLRLAPFGAGRRVCPGKALGLTTVSLWVATLLHEFEWVESDGNPVELSEVLRLSCEMAHPLTVKLRRRRRL